jgi:hypothetical protein
MKKLIVPIVYNWLFSLSSSIFTLIFHLVFFNHLSHIVFVGVTIYFLISTLVLFKVFFDEEE